jgi:hypothetical protein
VPTASGAPSSSGGAGRGAATNADGDNTATNVPWDDATLEAEQAVTPTKPGEKPESRDDQLRRTLKLNVWTNGVTLLYFHTPHEGVDKTKLVGAALATLRQCKTLHDETSMRWLALYHCVEVDMGKSDAKTAERLGCKDGALFAVIDRKLNVLATSKPVEKSDGVAAFLKSTLKSDALKTAWAPIQSQLDAQKKALDEARALVLQKKFKEAVEKYDVVLTTNVHVADYWDKAVKEAVDARRHADEAAK